MAYIRWQVARGIVHKDTLSGYLSVFNCANSDMMFPDVFALDARGRFSKDVSKLLMGFTKIAPLPPKVTYIKMDPLNPIRNGFANWGRPHSHFRVAWGSRHESSMVPKALKIATLQKKMAPKPPHTYRLEWS